MKIYLLLAEDPFYTQEFVDGLLKAFPGDIVEVAFPKGFINRRRILPTLLIYGPYRFIKTAIIVTYYKLKGGKVRSFLEEKGIATRTVENVNDPDFVNHLRSKDIDLIISNNCPQRLRENILNVPKKGAINLHLGKLPAYRGVFPVLHAIANGEDSFGATVHYMDTQFDNGDIILQEQLAIEPSDNLFTLYPKAFKMGRELVIEAVKLIEEKKVCPKPNGPEGKSYYSYPSLKQILKYYGILKQQI